MTPLVRSPTPTPRPWRILALGIVLSSCGGATVEGALARTGDPHRGRGIFQELCVECHGADGGGEIGPDLRDEPIPTHDLAERVLEGWGEMEGFADALSNQDAADLLAYLEEEIVGVEHDGDRTAREARATVGIPPTSAAGRSVDAR